ncbi:methyltransferase domain-containing protein, partial [Undibacterium sp.]|uniref:methyltransferase domain-containing protein n=1 Tax=Undibacterium sp. TaxID=1914977 RepID=UPI00374C8E2E
MLQQAIQWIHRNHLDGNAVPITHKQRRPYPEVTGYYIPTLLSIGEVGMAEQFARWLVTAQNADGSFSLDDPTRSYVFDTGQVIRGWVTIIDRLPELAEPLKRACDWIINGADPITGRLMVPAPGGDWSLGSRGEVSEGIHLYVLQPMRDAAAALGLPYIRAAADKALAYYLTNVPVTDFSHTNMLTHFYGYMQEALFEMGCIEEAKQGMASVAPYQLANGSVSAYSNVSWVCSTGLAQLAKVWYFLDDLPRADKAMEFLAQLQNGSGGFYGSYGVGATYFPADEISWAVKYTIEAEHLRIARHFDHTAHHYKSTIPAQDGRVQAIFSGLGNATRVLDAGCGKGRYAALIKEHKPETEVHAIDVSAEMLRHVPAGIQTQVASIQALPFPENSFDLVYCVEALEHVPNPQAALAEMARVLTVGGRLVIIDKNVDKQGALQIESWERWFDVEQLTRDMQALGLATHAEFISYEGRPADGLFVCWTGTKTLSVSTNAAPPATVNFYREEYFDALNRTLVDACRRNDTTWINAHLLNQDTQKPGPHKDELYENRVGLQLIAQLLQKSGQQFDIVDVACGNAMLLRKLRADGHRVQGIDASAAKVANNADVPLVQGFGEALPLGDQVADVVICLESAGHV